MLLNDYYVNIMQLVDMYTSVENIFFEYRAHTCSCFSIDLHFSFCNKYGVYPFNTLFNKFLLTQIIEIFMVNKLF